MKTAVLDTNFILACIKEKIDFIEDLQFKGFQVAVPGLVLDELEKLSEKKGAVKARAGFALRLLNAHNLKKIDLGTKNVDFGLVRHSKNNEGVVIATIDRALKRRIRGNKIVIRNKRRLEVV